MLVLASLYPPVVITHLYDRRSPLGLRPRPHPHVPPALRAPPPPLWAATHQAMIVVLRSGARGLMAPLVAGPCQPA